MHATEAAFGANAIPFMIVPVALVYKVTLLAVVILIAVLYPAASINLITELALVAPVPVVINKFDPVPDFSTAKPNPPNEVVYVPFAVHELLTNEYFEIVPAAAEVASVVYKIS